jgi:hypothetical protein
VVHRASLTRYARVIRRPNIAGTPRTIAQRKLRALAAAIASKISPPNRATPASAAINAALC